MKIARTTLVMLVLSGAAGLTPALSLKTDHDPAYDFSRVKTFTVKIGTSWNNELSEKRVMAAVELALAGKGWTKTDATSADAEVILHGSTRQKQDLQTYYSGEGSGLGWGGWGSVGIGTATTTAYNYTEGTLIVDIFDAKSKALIFRGSATDTVSNKAERNRKVLKKALDKIFKGFPPGSERK